MAGVASCVERCKAYLFDNPNISKPSSRLCSQSFAACTAQGKVFSILLIHPDVLSVYSDTAIEHSGLLAGALWSQQGHTICRGIHIKAMDSGGSCLVAWRMHLMCPANHILYAQWWHLQIRSAKSPSTSPAAFDFCESACQPHCVSTVKKRQQLSTVSADHAAKL